MTEPASGGAPAGTDPGGRRLLVAGMVGLLVGACALWGAGSLTWASMPLPAAALAGHAGVAGAGTVEATGRDLTPALLAVALLAIAAIAAAVALAGIARRVVGVLVAAAGLWAGWTALAVRISPPTPARLLAATGTPATGDKLDGVTVTVSAAPWLAVLGGVLVAVAAGVFVVADRRLPRLGARYAAPGGKARVDAERSAWEQLDEGVDPTVDGALAGGAEPAPRATPRGPEDRGAEQDV